ncbi:B-4DMT family transporter [Amycolatopsis sp. CA-230715]|uniref:B-4DMT family transporter n=1 Tax=Amycolatopsis sp. CA-230715 TaxID=2745196 RepID=UPI001C02B7AF|nr:B-4DMT family transporter [Amycolatopsis sp. CA-230715]
MPPWLLRGTGMGLLHAVAATLLAKVAVNSPTDTITTRVVTIALLVGAAALWSALDGWLRHRDLGRAWFIGALVAGVVAPILSTIGRAVFVDQTGIGTFFDEFLGTFAFTALLVLVPAGLGLFVGGRIGKAADEPERPKPSPGPKAAA